MREHFESRSQRVFRATKRLHEDGHTAEAVAICRWVLEHEPENPIAWHNFGYGCWKEGRIRQALECYDRAIALWPDYPEAWNNKGTALGELGRLEAWLSCATRAVALGPRGWFRLFNRAMALEKLGRFEEALHCYQRLRFLYPGSETPREAYRDTRETYTALTDALCRAEEEVIRNPRDVAAWGENGFALSQLYRLEDALNCYNQALELDPADDCAWANRGMVLRQLHSYPEALSNLDRAIALRQESAAKEPFSAWHQKGLCLAALGERSAAIDCHARTVELLPSHPTAWFDKAVLEDQLGRQKDAEASYRRFLEMEWPMYIGQKDWAQEWLADLEETSQ